MQRHIQLWQRFNARALTVIKLLLLFAIYAQIGPVSVGFALEQTAGEEQTKGLQ